jgi:hydrogenase maturation factor
MPNTAKNRTKTVIFYATGAETADPSTKSLVMNQNLAMNPDDGK